MKTIIQVLLIIHAISGGIALISGLFAIFSKKGQKIHLKSGLIYYWAMIQVVITGLIVGAYKGNIFISTIAVFSFYMVFTGRRILGSKKKLNVAWIDWFFTSLAITIGMLMLGLGIILFIQYGFNGAVPMLLVFGFFLLWMGWEDFNLMRRGTIEKGQYLLKHISRMGGSYIATSTAFLVVNIEFDPQWLVWLLPTAIGTPMITSASRKWKNMFKATKNS
tara:strand:- start:121 stop:780 length:660 start_codon:yes stop_codon:yes gene_type:complete